MEKKKFLLRLDPRVYEGLERWAADDLRSANAQIEWILAEALRKQGRLRQPGPGARPSDGTGPGEPAANHESEDTNDSTS